MAALVTIYYILYIDASIINIRTSKYKKVLEIAYKSVPN
jgi:hypothetical protein